MNRPYRCPACRKNGTAFELIYKLSREIKKDERSGAVLFQSDELTPLMTQDGRFNLDIRCERCNYVSSEALFIRTAQHVVG